MYDRHRLDLYRRIWSAGNLAGLYDALHDSQLGRERDRQPNDPIELPRWAVEGCLEWMEREIRASVNNKPCPTAKWAKAHVRDCLRHERYDMVAYLHGDPAAGYEHIEDEDRMSWNKAYDVADDALRRLASPAACSAEAVHQSYKRVKRDPNKLKYYPGHLQLQRLLGIAPKPAGIPRSVTPRKGGPNPRKRKV